MNDYQHKYGPTEAIRDRLATQSPKLKDSQRKAEGQNKPAFAFTSYPTGIGGSGIVFRPWLENFAFDANFYGLDSSTTRVTTRKHQEAHKNDCTNDQRYVCYGH